MCVRERERESSQVCRCVRETDRVREREGESERERESSLACRWVRETDRLRERERERVRGVAGRCPPLRGCIQPTGTQIITFEIISGGGPGGSSGVAAVFAVLKVSVRGLLSSEHGCHAGLSLALCGLSQRSF